MDKVIDFVDNLAPALNKMDKVQTRSPFLKLTQDGQGPDGE
jgi:hypothetical protein